MSPEDKIQYKRLSRQIGEAYDRLFDSGNGGRIKSRSPNLFNNRLSRMRDFLSSLEGDYSKNRFMLIDPLND